MQTLDDRQGRTVHQEGREGISTFSPLSAWRRYGDMGPKPARWSHQAPSEFGRLRQLESEGQRTNQGGVSEHTRGFLISSQHPAAHAQAWHCEAGA